MINWCLWFKLKFFSLLVLQIKLSTLMLDKNWKLTLTLTTQTKLFSFSEKNSDGQNKSTSGKNKDKKPEYKKTTHSTWLSPNFFPHKIHDWWFNYWYNCWCLVAYFLNIKIIDDLLALPNTTHSFARGGHAPLHREPNKRTLQGS